MGDCSLGLVTNEENHAEIDKKTEDLFPNREISI